MARRQRISALQALVTMEAKGKTILQKRF